MIGGLVWSNNRPICHSSAQFLPSLSANYHRRGTTPDMIRTTIRTACAGLLIAALAACTAATTPSATPPASDEASTTPSVAASPAPSFGIPEPSEQGLDAPPVGDQAATADYGDLLDFIATEIECDPQESPGVPVFTFACGDINLMVTYNADDVVIGVDAYVGFEGESPSAAQLDQAQAIIDATALDLEFDFAEFATDALATEDDFQMIEVDGYQIAVDTIESAILYYRIEPAFSDPLRMIAPDGMDLGPGGRGDGPVAPSDDPGDGD